MTMGRLFVLGKYLLITFILGTSLVAQMVKNLPSMQETQVQSLGREELLEKERLPTPIFWPGEFHGLYSPWGHKESDMTECHHYTVKGFGIFNETQSEMKVTQLCLTLCDPMDYTVQGILQARILEWIAISFFRGSSQPRVSPDIADRFFTS